MASKVSIALAIGLALASWPSAWAGGVADRDVALLIAIGTYDGRRADAVRFAERDAHRIGQVLRTHIGVPPDRVLTLFHRSSAPVSATRIDRAIDDVARLLAESPDARLWLYITGHGVMRAERSTGEAAVELRHRLILPHAPVDVRDWRSVSIDLDALLDRVDGLPIAHTLAMIDLCRRIVPGETAREDVDRPPRRRARTTVWWATHPGEDAFSRHAPPGAAFTGAVIAALDAGAQAPLTLRRADLAVRGSLRRFSRAKGLPDVQSPQLVPAASIAPEAWVLYGADR